MLNWGAVRVQTRSGTSLTNYASLDSFWTSASIGSYSNRATDPRVAYDPYHNRWLATCFVDQDYTSSAVLVGASRTSDPTYNTNWFFQRVKADTNGSLWADSPTIGFNKDWVVVQANMLTNVSRGYSRSHIWVFNKSNLYAGVSNAPVLFPHTNINASGSELPAVTYDNSLSALYLLQNVTGNTNGSGYLRLFSITGAVDSPALNYVTNPVYIKVTDATWQDTTMPTLTNWQCCFAPQSNTTERLGTAPDARVTSVVYRNGSLWTTQTIFLPTGNPTRSAVQWWQIDPESGAVVQRGRIDDPTGVNFYAFPSIAVNKWNDVLIGYSSFSTNYYASAAYSFRTFYDGRNLLRGTRRYWPGEAVYGTNGNPRWGDYSASCVDPLNDSDLWTIQEYATIPSEPDGAWGTRWAQVKVPIQVNDGFASYYTISGSSGTTNGTTYRSSRETGEPNHAGSPNTPSVWYRWVAPANGQVAFYVTNSTGLGSHAAIGLYTGSAVGSLTIVTNAHDNFEEGGSRVAFTATSNTTYQIAVAGYDGLTGDFALHWNQPMAPLILVQPETTNVVANTNENGVFVVQAIGNPVPTNLWHFNGTPISGATNATYTITNVQTNHNGGYTVIVGNASGSVTSSVASLIVHHDSAARLCLLDMTSNAFRVHISGLTNRPYVVLTSTNLATNWTTIYTNFVSFWYTNFNTTNDRQRFYRAITNN